MNTHEVIFCTYFDKNFLLKGLALHASLIRYSLDAKLWILALDKYTEQILKKMKLKNIVVVALEDFEDKELLLIKNSRNPIEYYWTCTPSWPLYIFKKNPKVKYVAYLDADLYFYSDPMVGVREIKNGSMIVVEHRFPKGMEHIAKDSGIFNVAFNVFRNDETGIKCLKRWRNQCLEWCYWRHEDGKLGDQIYLDEWPRLYGDNLIKSQNIGVDAAPWNISQYKVSKKGNFVNLNDTKLSCYHFHQFQILGPNNFSRVLGYTLSKDVINLIYEPYEKELREQYKIVKRCDNNFEIKLPKDDDNRAQILRQKLAKYIGPFYWKLKRWLGN